MREVIRSYCVYVLLGRPRRPLFVLPKYTLKAPTFWFAPARSLTAVLTGCRHMKLPCAPLPLLWELDALSRQYEGKVLTLLPLTEEMRDFVHQNEEILAEKFIIKKDSA